MDFSYASSSNTRVHRNTSIQHHQEQRSLINNNLISSGEVVYRYNTTQARNVHNNGYSNSRSVSHVSNGYYGNGRNQHLTNSTFSSGNEFNFPLRSGRNTFNGSSSFVGLVNRNGSFQKRSTQQFNPSSSNQVSRKFTNASKYNRGQSTNDTILHQNISSSNHSSSIPKVARNNPGKVKRIVVHEESPRGDGSGDEILEPISTGNISESSANIEPKYRIIKRGDSLPIENDDAGSQEESEQKKTENVNVDNKNVNGASSVVPNSSPSENQGSNSKAPIKSVSELARFNGFTPEYRLISESGPPHCPTFTVVLQLADEEHKGIGPSIKKAQIAAANEAITNSTLPKPPPKPTGRKNTTNRQSGGTNGRGAKALQKLSALAAEMNEEICFTSSRVNDGSPFSRGVIRVALSIGNRIYSGDGNTFQAAKQMCVLAALKSLMNFKKQNEENEQSLNEMEDDSTKSPISIVYEMSFKRNLDISYEIIKEDGPPHMKVFTVQCKVGDHLVTESDGFTKQQAKKLCSEQMIAKLKEIPLPGDHSLKFQHGLGKPKVTKKKPIAPVIKAAEKSSVSPVSRLVHIAHLRKYKEPEFIDIELPTCSQTLGTNTGSDPSSAKEGNSSGGKRSKRNPKLRKPHFAMEVKVGPFTCRGEGPNKKAAKNVAADNALVLLGYTPSEPKIKDTIDSIEEEATTSQNSKKKENKENSSNSSTRLVAGRQIVPGLLVLKNEPSNSSLTRLGSSQSTNLEINCENSLNSAVNHSTEEKTSSHVSPTSNNVNTSTSGGFAEGVSKLSYLAQLLGVHVSYTDFPKGAEYLSVVSLGTAPPHVSHGVGKTIEEARNSAALQVLSELSGKGLDNANEKSTEDIAATAISSTP